MVRMHPNDELLRRLVEGLTTSLLRKVLRHVVECDRCRERLRRILDGEEERPARVLAWRDHEYRRVLERVIERADRAGIPLRREQAEAPVLLGELLLLPHSERTRRLDEDPRFQSWALAELLLERSFEASFEDPDYGQGLAELGLAVTERLTRERFGPELIADLRARGLGYLANARRMGSDLDGARVAMEQAKREIKRGSGDSVEKGRLQELEASLLRDLRRFDAAVRLLKRVIAGYRAAEESTRCGRALTKLAAVLSAAERLDESVAVLREALDEIDRDRDPRLFLCAQHNLALTLTSLDRFMEARRVFRAARPLYRRFQDPWTQRRRLWLAGRLDFGLGQLDAAERHLEQARRGFLEQEIVYDAALVSLDLAAVYAQQGRAADLRRLGRGMLPVFNARGVHREARRALALFQRAAEVELVTVGLVRSLLAYLHRARHDPSLRFEL